MKKSIVMTLIIALLISLASMVNAVTLVPVTASMSGVPETLKEGDEFTVKIKLTNKETGNQETATMGGFRITYDASVLEYVSSNSRDPQITAGNVRLDYLGNTDPEFTVTFRVIGKVESKSTLTFEPIQFTQTDVELKADSVSAEVNVTAAQVTPEPQENTTVPGNQTTPTPEKPTEDPSNVAPKEDDGQKPTKIPQTGVNFMVIGGVIVAIVAFVAIMKKVRD